MSGKITETEKPLITLHWLEASRAQRIVWLLEELEVKYTLKLYHRNESQRADPELAKVFPLGKSPIVEVDYGNGSKVVLAESGHIINYLISRFDHNKKLTPATVEGKDQADFYLHYAEGTLQPYFTFEVVLDVALKRVPYLAKHVIGPFVRKVEELFIAKGVHENFNFLEAELAKKEYPLFFVGDSLTAADIALVFDILITLDGIRFSSSPFDIKADSYPNLKKWGESIKLRPAYKNAFKRVEKEGGGKYKILAI